jgi:hypothetical protein
VQMPRPKESRTLAHGSSMVSNLVTNAHGDTMVLAREAAP